ncbi:cingulin-like protein 1 isoform X2 [Pseudorasbora parva]|uniref:cingulin-like protein 1 isoform X2 n=1 Tax=Pseudorasbora parva TaxID=51549 RepID=UPI00351EE1F9
MPVSHTALSVCGSFGVKLHLQGVSGRHVVLKAQGLGPSPDAPGSQGIHSQGSLGSQGIHLLGSLGSQGIHSQGSQGIHSQGSQGIHSQGSQGIHSQGSPGSQGIHLLGSPDYPDVFPAEQRQQEFVSRMSGAASSAPTPDHYRSLRAVGSSSSPVMVKRARIPVPGVGLAGLAEPCVESVPCQPSHIICRPSQSPRPRLSPEEKRTRSSPEVIRVGSTSAGSEVKDETERAAQATPDLLKGQRELPDPPDEEAVKLLMVRFLKDGSCGGEPAVQRQVELMFNQINTLKLSALEENHQNLLDQEEERGVELKRLQGALERSEQEQVELKRLQGALERSEQEQVELRLQLTDMEKELQTSLDQLLQARRARDEYRCALRALQQQLSETHDELDSRSCEAGERDELLQGLCVLRAEFEALQSLQEQQEEALLRRERELKALRGALEDELSAHASDLQRLQQEHEQELQQLREATAQAKQSVALLGQKVLEVAEQKEANETLISDLRLTKAELMQKSSDLEEQASSLSIIIQQKEAQETQLRGHVEQLMVEKQNLEEELQEVRQQEEHMCGANRALTRHLEDTQSELSRLNRAHRELKERFEKESGEMEELRSRGSALEEERRSLERELERLQEEMSEAVLSSEQETQRLQEEVDALRDQSHKELNTLHTQLHNTNTQLHTHTHTAQEHQRERCVLEEKLSRCEFELNEAELKTQQLQKRIKELEENRHTHDDRHYKLMEVRVCELERSVMEERSGSDALMKRLERGREQMEQVRAELLQERAARHDLECDRIRLERQNKDLRSRVSQLEGSQRCGTDAAVSKLQLHVHELEERLLGEEKENGELQQMNRRLERRMKELTLHLDEERLELQDQRDQLALRLKTLKRQLDEAEEEMERLENNKKKLQRDLEEQQELNEQLHTELRRNRPIKLQTTADDEDDEDETEATLAAK